MYAELSEENEGEGEEEEEEREREEGATSCHRWAGGSNVRDSAISLSFATFSVSGLLPHALPIMRILLAHALCTGRNVEGGAGFVLHALTTFICFSRATVDSHRLLLSPWCGCLLLQSQSSCCVSCSLSLSHHERRQATQEKTIARTLI